MAVVLRLKQNRAYTIEPTSSDNWWRVLSKDTLLAIVMDKTTAFQVIYKDIHECGGSCAFLNKDDFVKDFRK